MLAKFLTFVNWWETAYEEGKVYDLDPVIFARLLRAGSVEPYKETVKDIPEEVEPEVEQPEAPVALKPVATFVPLPAKKPAKAKQKKR